MTNVVVINPPRTLHHLPVPSRGPRPSNLSRCAYPAFGPLSTENGKISYSKTSGNRHGSGWDRKEDFFSFSCQVGN